MLGFKYDLMVRQLIKPKGNKFILENFNEK